MKVLKAVKIYKEEEVEGNVVRAQYNENKKLGKEFVSYVEEDRVDPKSNTETFVALKLNIMNWRWSGVPICLIS